MSPTSLIIYYSHGRVSGLVSVDVIIFVVVVVVLVLVVVVVFIVVIVVFGIVIDVVVVTAIDISFNDLAVVVDVVCFSCFYLNVVVQQQLLFIHVTLQASRFEADELMITHNAWAQPFSLMLNVIQYTPNMTPR